ncbi:MAG: hypothetical protein ACOYOJ_13185 [Alsobacter sp.]
MIRVLAVATVMMLLAGPGLADGSRATVDAGKPDECPDYGSFAVVDSVPRQRGPVRAESYNPCADLPAPRGRTQPQLFIGADVQIGNQNGSQGSGQDQSGPSRPGVGGRPGPGTGTNPSVPRPAPVLVPVPGWSRPAH